MEKGERPMKKAMTLFLALTLALMMALPVLAEGAKPGSITVSKAVKGQVYSIYRILDLESYNGTAFAYKPNSDWETFIKSEGIKDVYLTINNDGYVNWVAEDKANNGTAVKAFAEKAKAYAKTNSIAAVATQTADGDTVTFTNLDLGYYLVDSTLGAVCSLDTTQPSVSMEEKNVPPTNEKKVEEDSTSQFGDTNDADIGQEITFKSTITVNANNKGYVFHDKMSEGLTYTGVKTITVNGDEEPVENNYTVKTTDLTDECTFEVEFDSDFCEALKADDEIVITYTAELNEKATIGLPGNPNKSWLEYGESGTASSSTVPSETITYTWDMKVLKYANGKKDTKLQGVEFVLLNKDKDKVATVANNFVTGWESVPAEGAEWPTGSKLTTDANGEIIINGLDADTYYLKEIKTLPGFNMLAQPVEVVITGKIDDNTYTTLVKEVENNSGVEMPSTGGIGTTIFYVAGGLLVAVAVVLLVTKKKMSATK